MALIRAVLLLLFSMFLAFKKVVLLLLFGMFLAFKTSVILLLFNLFVALKRAVWYTAGYQCVCVGVLHHMQRDFSYICDGTDVQAD